MSWNSDLEIYRIDVASNMRNLGIDLNNSKCTGMIPTEEAVQCRYIQSTLMQHKTTL
jgi:hypothetical protein